MTTKYNPPPADVIPSNLEELAGDGFILLINCRPQVGDVVFLSDVAAARASAIACRHGVRDIHEIKYGEGITELCNTFRDNPPTGVVVAYPGRLTFPVIDVLTPMAKQVIRGGMM